MSTWGPNDHDVLVRVETIVGRIERDVKDLKEGSAGTMADHARRLRVLEDAAVESRARESGFWTTVRRASTWIGLLLALTALAAQFRL